MKFIKIKSYKTICILIFASVLFAPFSLEAARKSTKSVDASEEDRTEYKANDLLNRGLELIDQQQEERGLKIIQSVPEMYPETKAKFKAYVALGDYYISKYNYDAAVKQLLLASKSDDENVQAESLYRTGICYYNMNKYDKAFMILRRVTNEYPWSVYANESFYYIGMCHFKLKNWTRAIEALEMVGTSVPLEDNSGMPAELGQRLFVKIYDKDLIVLLDSKDNKDKVKVTLDAATGDKEEIELEILGKSGTYYLGSIQSIPGKAVPGDGILQCMGTDNIKVIYNDKNTATGERNQKVLTSVDMVSSASIGFTDGAYREYTKGVFGNQEFFVRVKDLDQNVSDQQDTINANVFIEYKQEKEKDYSLSGIDLDEQKDVYVQRDSMNLTLIESDPSSGIFVGSAKLKEAMSTNNITSDDDILHAQKGDFIVLEYVDESNISQEENKLITYRAKVLIGAIQDVKIEHREVDSLQIKAEKDIIEGKIYRKLGQIFKDVGLNKQADEKADEGLDRVNNVIKIGMKAKLDRSFIEEAFNIKWDLFLIQDKLNDVIRTCNTLIKLYPDSPLVDQALMKVAIAKMESEDPKAKGEAIQIMKGIIGLPNSTLKAEAQFMIAQSVENQLIDKYSENSDLNQDFSSAMVQYKKVLDNYPDSMFAGQALEKISNYYISTKDYQRAIEMMEQVFQDYPDASFLDQMLYKWTLAAYRLGQLDVAKQKCEQLLSQYPDSSSAPKAKKIREILIKKLGE
jgi:TolA-binding protein